MTNGDLHQEMELLREQLKDFKREKAENKSKSVASKEDEAISQTGSNDSHEELEIPSRINTENLIDQFKELIDALDRDIKDARPTTLLAVFALGVLVGRL